MKPISAFFGTPRFAVPALEAIADLSDLRLVASQPDREAGRGRKVAPTPVKEAARRLGVPVVQPQDMKDEAFLAALRGLGADFFFVVAYGRILPEAILGIPCKGCINLHASLLPCYRGCAPIQWAVLWGEKVTGLTLMLMDRRMDTGPVIDRLEVPIGDDENACDLAERLSCAAPGFIRRALPRYLAGELAPVPQDDSEATLAPMINKEDGLIDWSWSAAKIVRHVRGMNPWPFAYAFARGKRTIILRAEAAGGVPPALKDSPPGAIGVEGGQMLIRCGDGAVRILEVQPEGKRPMPACTYLCGNRPPGEFDCGNPVKKPV